MFVDERLISKVIREYFIGVRLHGKLYLTVKSPVATKIAQFVRHMVQLYFDFNFG